MNILRIGAMTLMLAAPVGLIQAGSDEEYNARLQAVLDNLGLDAATGITIPELAIESGRLETLVAAVQAADLVEALNSDGPFTVFAPTDAAFNKLEPGTVEALLNEPGRRTLSRILLNHVVPQRLEAADLLGMDSVETLAGTTLDLTEARGRLLVGSAVVESADLGASNGVVHIIDEVLIPPMDFNPLETLLTSAVDRGVPLFNHGDPAACAAVYATALEAVVLTDGWGLDEHERERVAFAIRDVQSMHDSAEQAWGYRRIIDALLTRQQMMRTASRQ